MYAYCDSLSYSPVSLVLCGFSWLWPAVFSMVLGYTRNNDSPNIETHKHELNGLLVGGIRDNKGSHKWSKSKWIRGDEGKRSGGARRAEEAETGSHRVMWKQRRLREVWCKGSDLSNSNRLATQRGQLPLSPSLSRQDKKEQALDGIVKEAEYQRQAENERSKGQNGAEMRKKSCWSTHLHLGTGIERSCMWVCVRACVCGAVCSHAHVRILVYEQVSRDGV